jgi:hypothetical protein
MPAPTKIMSVMTVCRSAYPTSFAARSTSSGRGARSPTLRRARTGRPRAVPHGARRPDARHAWRRARSAR